MGATQMARIIIFGRYDRRKFLQNKWDYLRRTKHLMFTFECDMASRNKATEHLVREHYLAPR
jgi:hypothetical protein